MFFLFFCGVISFVEVVLNSQRWNCFFMIQILIMSQPIHLLKPFTTATLTDTSETSYEITLRNQL